MACRVFPRSYLISLQVTEGNPLTCECSRIGERGGAWVWVYVCAPFLSRSRGITSSCLHLLLLTPHQEPCCQHILSRMFPVTPGSSLANVINHFLCIASCYVFRLILKDSSYSAVLERTHTGFRELMVKLLGFV